MLPMKRTGNERRVVSFDFWCKRFVCRVSVFGTETPWMYVPPSQTERPVSAILTERVSGHVPLCVFLHIRSFDGNTDTFRVYSVCYSGYHFHIRVSLMKMSKNMSSSYFTPKSKDLYIFNKILQKWHVAWFKTFKIFLHYFSRQLNIFPKLYII